MVDYSGFTVVVEPAELDSANVVDILEQRFDRTARLQLMKRLHQVGVLLVPVLAPSCRRQQRADVVVGTLCARLPLFLV
jgi:hypothetical protein